jgi:hypothetical protein
LWPAPIKNYFVFAYARAMFSCGKTRRSLSPLTVVKIVVIASNFNVEVRMIGEMINQ